VTGAHHQASRNIAAEFAFAFAMGPPARVLFTGRKGRSWPPQIGRTCNCWAAPEAAEELEDLTFRVFRSIGLTNGLASMRYKRD
jgi:hypothetical protein